MSKFYKINTPYGGEYNIVDKNGTIYLGGSKYYCTFVGINGNGDDLFIHSGKDCVINNNFPDVKIPTREKYTKLLKKILI